MTIVIGYISGIQYWRARSKTEPLTLVRLRELPHTPEKLDSESLLNLANLGITLEPIHTLCPKASSRTNSLKIKPHVWTNYTGAKLFVKAASGVYICSPELCFIQLVPSLTFAERLMLGYELCGSYKAEENNAEPLTNIKKLTATCDMLEGYHGSKVARNSLPFILEGSRSPRESVTAILLSLPRRFGGEGLPAPRLNLPIETTTPEAWGLGGIPLKCDLYWPDGQIGLEYESKLHHSSEDATSTDSQRRTAFSNRGVHVITLTNRELLDTRRFDPKVKELRRLLKVKKRYDTFNWEKRRNHLRKELLFRPKRGII